MCKKRGIFFHLYLFSLLVLVISVLSSAHQNKRVVLSKTFEPETLHASSIGERVLANCLQCLYFYDVLKDNSVIFVCTDQNDAVFLYLSCQNFFA